MSYLSTLMALLTHLDLFSKHIASQGNVHLQFCLFREQFASAEVELDKLRTCVLFTCSVGISQCHEGW